MSARKWPHYELKAGESVTLERIPYWLPRKIYQYGSEKGKRFSVRPIERGDPDSPVMITRLK